jgi:cardiolipin synthase
MSAKHGRDAGLNLPNFLTICRFFMIPLFVIVFFLGHGKLAFLLLVLAGATDVLDGYLARKRGQTTELGSMLDPLADKTMMIVVILSFLISGKISWEAAAAIFIRDAGMIAGSAFFHFRGKKTVPANAMGKITTVLYYLAILFIIYDFPFAMASLWIVIVFSFITSFIYIFKFKSINRVWARQPDK